ncbi:MAG: TlpA family protein disulfide reductase [Nannocystaceae bacterium]|nr:TlpA family protein disulfide reductase [Deltaproteobacteria bacterium]MBK8716798.1 TlpA family protein disulfide reductase [Deltaproteobacteria bacterium]MBP7291720.1 TlpA family protein disulfide reductase [Nannocystaceae bacterium]
MTPSSASPTPAPPRSGLDPLGALAYAVYVALGGLLVFGFAWALLPAVARQNDAVCHALAPEERDTVAPDFVVQDLQGNEVKLSDFRGKLVVLNFWATWCPPCITEWPQVHQLAERLSGRDDVVVIALSIDKSPDVIEPFLARMSMADTHVKVLWDPNEQVHTDFGTTKLPDTYFVDETGTIRQAYINARKWGSPTAVQCVESMIGR